MVKAHKRGGKAYNLSQIKSDASSIIRGSIICDDLGSKVSLADILILTRLIALINPGSPYCNEIYL